MKRIRKKTGNRTPDTANRISYTQSFLFLLLYLWSSSLFAQNEFVYIDSIIIEGNKKTKDRTILRELDIKIGDSLRMVALMPRLKENERLLFNTGLFGNIQTNISNWDTENHRIIVSIIVNESWYIWPIPVIELADRNFNVWWVEYQRSLKRINFGIDLFYSNLTGRNDPLKVITQLGYTQKLELDYYLPFFNKKQTLGFDANILYSRNKEIPYRTIGNRWEFDRQEDFLLYRFRVSTGLIFRPRLFTTQKLKLSFYRNYINNYVVDELNIDFLLDGRFRQRFFSLEYEFLLENRDFKPYPLTGNLLKVALQKDGLGIFKDLNRLMLSATIWQYFSFNKRWSFSLTGKGKVAIIRQKEPYFNLRGLGFAEDYLRGYEYYVIDGTDYVYLKTSLRYNIVDGSINWGRMVPLKQFKVMPLRIFLTLNNDTGYVVDKYYSVGNPFSNQLLWGGGIGLDFVVYLDKVIQIEYSWNEIGENGLFLHYKFSF